MRISDWSSDVCSSDLLAERRSRHGGRGGRMAEGRVRPAGRSLPRTRRNDRRIRAGHACALDAGEAGVRGQICLIPRCRSEEHTSELQSLMRISYAVFCLKKKRKDQAQEGSIPLKITYIIIPSLIEH